MNSHTQTDTLLQHNQTPRCRFCDRFGLTGMICFALFIAFMQLLPHAGKLYF